MGLRPTNSDENHVRQAPRLRPPLTPPERVSISYGGFSTVRGTSTSRQMAGLETRRRTGVLPH